jgi:exosortase
MSNRNGHFVNKFPKQFWMVAAATAVVLGLAYGPLLMEFFANQWTRPHYQYFPFVIGAFALLLWQRCAQAEPRHKIGGAAYWIASCATFAGAAALLPVAYVANSPWLAYVSLIALVTSCFLRVSASWRVPYLWGIWLFLWLILPMPLSRDQQLISFLQRVSSKLSSIVLDWASVPHLMEGNTLRFAEKQFFVDDACSGIVSVMSIIACAVIYGVWRNRPPMHLATLAVAGVGWATLMNVVRISVIAMAYYWYGVDWSKGTPHEILGLLIFLCTFLALVSTDYALAVLLAPIKGPGGQLYTDSVRFGRRLVDAWDWLQGLGRPMMLAGASASEPMQGSTFRVQGSEAGFQRSADRQVTAACTVREESTGNTESRREELASRFVFGWVPLGLLGAVASLQLVVPFLFQQQPARPTASLERALALDETAIPKKCATVVQASYAPQERDRDDIFGNFSQTYEYRD